MKATPSFVPIIENNLINEKKEDIIKELSIFRNSDILVLGCTHYPLLKSITDEMNINTLDMGEVLMNKLELTNEGNGTCELYFSLLNDNLTHNVNNILKDNYQIYKK
jgi:glutamate racemase